MLSHTMDIVVSLWKRTVFCPDDLSNIHSVIQTTLFKSANLCSQTNYGFCFPGLQGALWWEQTTGMSFRVKSSSRLVIYASRLSLTGQHGFARGKCFDSFCIAFSFLLFSQKIFRIHENEWICSKSRQILVNFKALFDSKNGRKMTKNLSTSL